MIQIKAEELATQPKTVLRRVEEDGETVEITRHGKVVAKLMPTPSGESHVKPLSDEEIDRYLADLDAFAAEIAQESPEGVSALDVIADIRRDL